MAYEMVMPYHLHMPSYFLETFTEYPYFPARPEGRHPVAEKNMDKASLVSKSTRIYCPVAGTVALKKEKFTLPYARRSIKWGSSSK